MFVAVMLSIRTKGILVSEWAFLLFQPLLIYELLLNGPAFVRLGEPFSWLTHLNGGHRWTLLFRRTSPGWCGELAGKRLFPVCGSHQHIKCHILVKTGVFCFCGKENVWKRRRKCAVLRVTFAQFPGKKVWPKFLEHSFVREFAVVVSLSFSDLWVCFGGGFQTKKWCYDFSSRERARLLFLRGASVHFSETLPEKV